MYKAIAVFFMLFSAALYAAPATQAVPPKAVAQGANQQPTQDSTDEDSDEDVIIQDDEDSSEDQDANN